jgi:NAD+ synthase
VSSPAAARAVGALDLDAECARIESHLRESVERYSRRGLVVAVSGGIDSSVCAALATRAVGPERVYALMLPERASSQYSRDAAHELVAQLGIRHELQDIAPALDAIGCYRAQEEAVRTVLPEFGPNWGFKLAISSAMGGKVAVTKLVARDPGGNVHEKRLPAESYLKLVAATNYKQRIRKAIEYYHADRLNYLVVGTPNLLEYELGFFVKNGDGAADVKPIAHLYKTEVYSIARHLRLPAMIVGSSPTTDTFSLPQGQDEFYYGLPYDRMDVALSKFLAGAPASELAAALGIDANAAESVYAGIRAKRRMAEYLDARPAPLR